MVQYILQNSLFFCDALISRPVYSPCDFLLFPYLKKKLRELRIFQHKEVQCPRKREMSNCVNYFEKEIILLENVREK